MSTSNEPVSPSAIVSYVILSLAVGQNPDKEQMDSTTIKYKDEIVQLKKALRQYQDFPEKVHSIKLIRA